ncbi:MAG TPA: hypothetical protein VFU88_12980 [Ktedonobacterales bacterium]|nr:hypothetical protein [Ktedonobacterales bacterium]
MSGPNTDGADDTFVVSPREEHPHHGEAPLEDGTERAAAERRYMLQHRVANPGDPPVRRPPRGGAGPMPGPDFTGAPGRVAIVQGQVYLVGVILVTQLVLCTLALYELLSGRAGTLWWIAGLSLAGFLIALLVALWPRRRTVSY